jgi:hypothetical protein
MVANIDLRFVAHTMFLSSMIFAAQKVKTNTAIRKPQELTWPRCAKPCLKPLGSAAEDRKQSPLLVRSYVIKTFLSDRLPWFRRFRTALSWMLQ